MLKLSEKTQMWSRDTIIFFIAVNVDFEVFVSCRSADCRVIRQAACVEKNCCQPCATAFNAVNRVVKRESKASAEPAKSKASLAACGAEKLRATVQATRLECKQLQDRLKHLQTKIEKDGVGVCASLETELLKIMGGQNLKSTPHMKFFLGTANGTSSVK